MDSILELLKSIPIVGWVIGGVVVLIGVKLVSKKGIGGSPSVISIDSILGNLKITEEELNELSTIIETQQNQLTTQETELKRLSELLQLQRTVLTEQTSELTSLKTSITMLYQQLTLSQTELEIAKTNLVEQKVFLTESAQENQQIEDDLKTFHSNLALDQWIERGIWLGLGVIAYFVGTLAS